MSRTKEQRIEAGNEFTDQYQVGVSGMLTRIRNNDGTIAQEALLTAYEVFARTVSDNLERERAKGITFSPAFTGALYGLVNGQNEVVRVQTRDGANGATKEIGVNPRILLWTAQSPIHTHVVSKDAAVGDPMADKDLSQGEALCAFFLAGGAATNAEFSLTGASQAEGYVYDAVLNQISTAAQGTLTCDTYKGTGPRVDKTDAKQLSGIYTHQFTPQAVALEGVYILDAKDNEFAVRAVTANVYNGIQPKNPAQGDKAHDVDPKVTDEATKRLANLPRIANEEGIEAAGFAVNVRRYTARDSVATIISAGNNDVSLSSETEGERPARSFLDTATSHTEKVILGRREQSTQTGLGDGSADAFGATGSSSSTGYSRR